MIRTTITYVEGGGVHRVSRRFDMPLSAGLEKLIERYDALVDASLPKLSREEWLAIVGSHWGHAFSPFEYERNLLWLNLDDADPEDIEDWGLTESARQQLIAKIKSFSRVEHYAALERLVAVIAREIDVEDFLASVAVGHIRGDPGAQR